MANTLSIKSHCVISIITSLLLVLVLVPFANPEGKVEQHLDENAKKRLLKQEATNALWRLKRALEKDGFYSGRVALNIWRSTAMDAGTFDQTKYEKIRKQLYEKSVNDSMRCFEEFLLEENFYDANFCLQIWRMHTKELGTYDEKEYEALKTRLTDAKSLKASKETEEQTPD